MKLKKEFLLHHTGEETILVATGDAAFSGILRGNKTLGVILDELQKGIGEEELIARLEAQYEADEGEIEKDVRKVIAELRKIGALDD